MTEEEIIVMGRSNLDDERFDNTIGALEDIIMDDDFQDLQDGFMEKYYHEFEDTEENKLVYMDIFREYTDMLEHHIEKQLSEKIPGFSMDEFQKCLLSKRDQIDLEIFEMLQTLTDFLEFKQMFLNYKAMKEGTMVDFSNDLVVKHLSNSEDIAIDNERTVDITGQFSATSQ